jgi:nucleotide-binding universal stress UspA family protein
MKKVLVAFTPASIPGHVLKFSIGIAKEHNWVLQSIFLVTTPSPLLHPFTDDLALEATETTNVNQADENDKLVNDNIRIFRDYCERAGIHFEEGKYITKDQLIEYSSLADLIITDARITFSNFSLTDVLTDAHCPVCLVSETSAEVKHIIFAYDGSDSSKYAIERFMAVFPKLNQLPAYLVSINPGVEVLEHKEFINQTLPGHFQNYTLQLFEGNVKEVMDNFLKQFPVNAIIVMGAFGRSALSRLFHPSLAKEILNETSATVFIAHETVSG